VVPAASTTAAVAPASRLAFASGTTVSNATIPASEPVVSANSSCQCLEAVGVSARQAVAVEPAGQLAYQTPSARSMLVSCSQARYGLALLQESKHNWYAQLHAYLPACCPACKVAMEVT
jgi:hypothetical protein